MLNVRGPRLNNSMQEKNSKMYGTDKRLFVDIQSLMPKVKVVVTYVLYLSCQTTFIKDYLCVSVMY